MRSRFLLLSTDAVFREAAKMEAQSLRLQLEAASSAGFAATLYAATPDRPPHVVLIDLPAPERESATRWAHMAFPAARVVLLEAAAEPAMAAGTLCPPAQRAGDPIQPSGEALCRLRRDPPGIRAALEALTREAEADHAPGRPVAEGIGIDSLDELIGRSVKFREALELAMKAAAEPASPVLITGETGTGKRLFARAIHAEIFGPEVPFIRVDCRALNARDLDALLSCGPLQPARPASGAGSHSGGARGGTLFLEEITALDAGRQKKVLQFLDAVIRAKTLRQAPEPPAFKVIAATAREIDERRPEGSLCSDLLAKFSPYRIDLPPLRERPSDILLLAERFLHHRRSGSPGRVPALSQEVQAKLLSNPWPGNVRELFGVLEAAIDQAGDATEITMNHLPDWILEQKNAPAPASEAAGSSPSMQTPASRARVASVDGELIVELPPEGMAFEVIEKAILKTALQMAGNNVVRAARLLRLGRGSLRYRLEKYGLVEPKRRRSAKRRPVSVRETESQENLRRAS